MPGSGILNVRARCKEDLDNLKDIFPDKNQIRLPQADYLWRIEVTREEWANAVAILAREIDYSNFKSETALRMGWDRAHIYSNVWHDLLEIENEHRHDIKGYEAVASFEDELSS